MTEDFEFAVVGAGFFGCRVAMQLARLGYRIALIERSAKVCQRASRVNQGRIHMGYHYPRSLMTAQASRHHYRRFLREFQECSQDGFKHVYAIARHRSHVTADQFKRFCHRLGLPITQAEPEIMRLFSRDWIEDAFVVEEGVIDVAAFGKIMEQKVLAQRNITLMLEKEVERLTFEQGSVILYCAGGSIRARGVYLVPYGNVNRLLTASGLEPLDLKAEITEICLVEVPEAFRNLGATVIDGAFFSCIPWPAGGCHSFTHVRYTPHVAWNLREQPERSPYDIIAAYPCKSRFDYMVRDARRLMPLFDQLRHRESLFEVKVVPSKHEIDDGRPILFRIHSRSPFCASMVGAKLDCVYDLEEIIANLALRHPVI